MPWPPHRRPVKRKCEGKAFPLRSRLHVSADADPLGLSDQARFPGPRLSHFPPDVVTRWRCPQGRARQHRRPPARMVAARDVDADRFIPDDEKKRAEETG